MNTDSDDERMLIEPPPDDKWRVMTVGQLRDAIADLPADMPVEVAYDSGFGVEGASFLSTSDGRLVFHIL